MSTKTPEQIANDLYWSGAFTTPLDGKGAEIRRVMAQAIEADRAQRGIVAQIAEALDGRGATAAAALVRDTDPDDDLWNNYIGPMIDSIEDDYTAMAAEMEN